MKEPIRLAIYLDGNRVIKGIFTELPEHETPVEIALHTFDQWEPDNLTDEERQALGYSRGKWYLGTTSTAVYAPEVIENIFSAGE